MKLKLSEIVNAQEQIKKLVETKLPVKVSFKINKLIVSIQPDLKIFEDKRNELVKEYGGVPDEAGMIKVTDPEKLKVFMEKVSELVSIEVEIDFEPIKIQELGDIVLAPKDLVPFMFIE